MNVMKLPFVRYFFAGFFANKILPEILRSNPGTRLIYPAEIKGNGAYFPARISAEGMEKINLPKDCTLTRITPRSSNVCWKDNLIIQVEGLK